LLAIGWGDLFSDGQAGRTLIDTPHGSL